MIVLDERGKSLPPFLWWRRKKALEAAASGETARVLVDNEIAVQNLRKLADHKGWSFCWEKRGGGDFQAWITREAGEIAFLRKKQRETEEPECPDCRTEGIRPGLTAVISSEAMGQGDDRLGKNSHEILSVCIDAAGYPAGGQCCSTTAALFFVL